MSLQSYLLPLVSPFVLIRIISLELSTLHVWEIVSLFFLFEIKIEVYQKKKTQIWSTLSTRQYVNCLPLVPSIYLVQFLVVMVDNNIGC